MKLLLTINDIRTWLIQNRSEYQNLKANEFPPIENGLYTTFGLLKEFIEYYKFKHNCDKSLTELNEIINTNFSNLCNWTKHNEVLDSQDLLMFEINYIKWNEDVSCDKIKIQEGLYTEREPFANILCFCKVFQHLYWDNNIHERELTKNEKVEVITKLKSILKTYYVDNIHD